MKTIAKSLPSPNFQLSFLLMAIALCFFSVHAFAREHDNQLTNRDRDNDAFAERMKSDPHYRANAPMYTSDNGYGRREPANTFTNDDDDDHDQHDNHHDYHDKNNIRWHGSRNVYFNDNNNTVSRANSNIIVRFSDVNRARIAAYLREDYRTHHCPPGLVRNFNSCRPPIHHVDYFVIGQPVPPTVVLGPPPQDLTVLLSAPPQGTHYMQTPDGDIILVGDNGYVLDTVTLVSTLD